VFWESLGIKARALQRSGGKQTLTRPEISGTMPTSRSLCSSPVSNLNALFINENLSQHERIVKLNTIAINQMKLLTDDTGIRKNRGVVVRNDRGIWGYEYGESVTRYFLIPGFPGFYSFSYIPLIIFRFWMTRAARINPAKTTKSTPPSTNGENTDVPSIAALNRSTRYVRGEQ